MKALYIVSQDDRFVLFWTHQLRIAITMLSLHDQLYTNVNKVLKLFLFLE